uniref:Uncharacterized protein n=1 Tax=Ditylenchus dipsaci TaxID=166011 RepID=A0A915EJQ6_9BILA
MWYVLSMLVIGIGIVLRVLLNVLYFGLPTLLESHDSFRLRLETNQMFSFFIPSGVSELTEDLVGGE